MSRAEETGARLLRWVLDEGIESEALDDLVYDVTDRLRAAAYNAGEGAVPTGLGPDDDAEAFAATFDDVASSVNNGGVDAQVGFLVEHLGAAEAEREIRRITE